MGRPVPSARRARGDGGGPPRARPGRRRWPARERGRAGPRRGWRTRRRRLRRERGAELRSGSASVFLDQKVCRDGGKLAGFARKSAAFDCAVAVAADQSVKKPLGIAFADVLEGVGHDVNAPAAVGSPLKNSWNVPTCPRFVGSAKGPTPAVKSRM